MKPRLQLEHSANWLVQSHSHCHARSPTPVAHMPGDVKLPRLPLSPMETPEPPRQTLELPTCGDNAELSYLSNVETLGSSSTSGLCWHWCRSARNRNPDPDLEWQGRIRCDAIPLRLRPCPCPDPCPRPRPRPRRFVSLSVVASDSSCCK